MQTFTATVYYQGRAEYQVTAKDPLGARREALRLFDEGEPSQGVSDVDSLETTSIEIESGDHYSDEQM